MSMDLLKGKLSQRLEPVNGAKAAEKAAEERVNGLGALKQDAVRHGRLVDQEVRRQALLPEHERVLPEGRAWTAEDDRALEQAQAELEAYKAGTLKAVAEVDASLDSHSTGGANGF